MCIVLYTLPLVLGRHGAGETILDWLWFFEPQSWRGKFSDICDEIQIGVVPFLYSDNKQLCVSQCE